MIVSTTIELENPDFPVTFEANVYYEDFSIGGYEYWGDYGHQPPMFVAICEDITIKQEPVLNRMEEQIAQQYLLTNYEKIQSLLVDEYKKLEHD